MNVLDNDCLVTGRIRHHIDRQWYPYTMRILKDSDLPGVLALYDAVIESLADKDMLWRYPNETVAAFLGQDGIVVGTFADQRLVGFRAVYFHHNGDPDNPLLHSEVSYTETAHFALSVVHPDFRGNSLQKKMSARLLSVAQASRTFDTLCSVVAPNNYPSIIDKFSLNMVVVKLMPKFKGLWRYIFYRDMNIPVETMAENLVFAASDDYPKQIELLEQGYCGVQLDKQNDETGMLYRKKI